MTGWFVLEVYTFFDDAGCSVENSAVYLSRDEAVKEFNARVSKQKAQDSYKSCEGSEDCAVLYHSDCFVYVWLREIEINGGD